jgi:hypothetical protein
VLCNSVGRKLNLAEATSPGHYIYRELGRSEKESLCLFRIVLCAGPMNLTD